MPSHINPLSPMNRKFIKKSSSGPSFAPNGASSLALVLAAIAASASVQSSYGQVTGWNKTAAGSYDYNDAANWVGGAINGQFDPSLTLTGAITATFGSNTPLGTGLNLSYGGSQNFSFTGTTAAVTVTLGGDIVTNTGGSQTITFGSATASKALNVDLGGQTRAFSVGTGQSLGFINAISNGGLTIDGGTINFSGVNTYSGNTTVNSGIVSLNGAAGSSANSDFTVNGGASSSTLRFSSTLAGNTGTTRAKSVTLNGVAGSATSPAANLSVVGNATANSNDVITNALSVEGGLSAVTVSSNAARNARVTAESFVRDGGSTVLFRGTNLGTNAIGSGTNSANIVFTTAPTLTGTGALNSTTAGIIKGAYGDTTTSGAGTAATGGLVTYDSSTGVRLLNGSEYATSITSGQTELTNVRLANTGGSGIATTTLAAGTTSINSLSFSITGSGTNGGIVLTGDPGSTLVLNSGVIFATQLISTSTNTTNAMTISVSTLNLNGNEGVILAGTSGLTSTRSGGTLDISSEITNDGGKGVTIGGSGVTKFLGSASNTYTGVTTVNSGILYLGKSGGAVAVGGDLVLNGGSVEQGSNQFAATSNITINGGSFSLRVGNEGNSRNITFNNLTMNGGSYGTGSGGHSGLSTINGTATIAGGAINQVDQSKITIAGLATFSGGTINLSKSVSASVHDTITTFNGGLSLVNTASGTYTPINISAGTSPTVFGGKVVLAGDLTFTGNATNTNTVLISGTVGASGPAGVFAISGTRNFTIGDGAAAKDLTISAPIVDVASGTQGGMIKGGLGTLELTGANTYTGGTTVNAGTLIINGSMVSSVTVNGGRFTGTGSSTGALSIGNSGTLAPGNSPGTINTGALSLSGTAATIAMEISGTGAGQYDQVNVTGGVNLDGNGKIEVSMLSYVPQPSDIYFLILNDDVDAISGTLYGIAQGGTFSSGGYTWQVSYTGNSATNSFTGGNDLALQVIPEPAAWMLVTGGLMAVTFMRRRRSA